MLLKITVFITAISLIFVLLMIVRQQKRSKNVQSPEMPEEENKSWSDKLRSLPLNQLAHKSLVLETQQNQLMDGFLLLDSMRQREVFARISKIKEKKAVIQEEINMRASFDNY